MPRDQDVQDRDYNPIAWVCFHYILPPYGRRQFVLNHVTDSSISKTISLRSSETDNEFSDVTISKFRFSIDFDSIFSPKWRFRFDSILVTPTLNHSRQNSVTQTPGSRHQSDLLPLQNRPAFANWCELARYVSAGNSLPRDQWPIPHTSRICRRQSDRWQPCSHGRIYSHLSRGPPISNIPRNLMHGIDGSCYCWLIPLSIMQCFSLLEITAVIYEIATSIIVYVIELSRVTCKLGRLRWTTNSHGGKHFGWQADCGSEIAHCYVEI